MRKSVHPPVKFELLPIGQNIIHKISSSSTSKNRPVFARGAASDYVPSDYAQWANPRTTILEKRIIDLGTSRRDCGLAPGSVWLSLLSLLVENEHERKNVKIETDQI